MKDNNEDSGIAGLLEHIHSGKETLQEEIDAHIKEAHRLLMLNGGKARITVTIDLKREPEYDNFYKITGRSVLKPPASPAKAAPMFGDHKNGGFTSQQQEQANIFDALTPAKDHKPTALAPASGNVSTLNR